MISCNKAVGTMLYAFISTYGRVFTFQNGLAGLSGMTLQQAIGAQLLITRSRPLAILFGMTPIAWFEIFRTTQYHSRNVQERKNGGNLAFGVSLLLSSPASLIHAFFARGNLDGNLPRLTPSSEPRCGHCGASATCKIAY